MHSETTHLHHHGVWRRKEFEQSHRVHGRSLLSTSIAPFHEAHYRRAALHSFQRYHSHGYQAGQHNHHLSEFAENRRLWMLHFGAKSRLCVDARSRWSAIGVQIITVCCLLGNYWGWTVCLNEMLWKILCVSPFDGLMIDVRWDSIVDIRLLIAGTRALFALHLDLSVAS